MANKAMISVNGVSRSYLQHRARCGGLFYAREEKAVFRDVSFQIPDGGVTGITGANGSGKTTLLKLLCGLYSPSSGKIYIDGYDTARFRTKLKSVIRLSLSAERGLFWRMTGWQNADFISALNGVYHDDQYRKRVQECSEMLELDKAMADRVETYSSGMKEKLSYLISLIPPRPIMVFDDFGKNSDQESLSRLRAYLRTQLKSGVFRMIILSSPSAQNLQPFADTLYQLRAGTLQTEVK